MTERALPLADGASACPFVAFDDDRDERASVPDHRHRCYAETPPAPRALAHQEAYCLSTAFPVCPTFQDWARREAARARGGPSSDAVSGSRKSAPAEPVATHEDDAPEAVGLGLAAAAASPSTGSGDEPPEEPDREHDTGPDTVRRNPPRDWAAPPPWLASAEGSGRDDADPPPFLGRRTSEPGQGLAGSAADRLAGGPPPARRTPPDDAPWAAGAAAAAAASSAGAPGAAGADRGTRRAARPAAEADDWEPDESGAPRRATRRPRAYDQHLGGTGTDGPDWERPRRYEAYPTIRTRMGMPQVPRLAMMAGAIALLAIALFFLPSLLNLGGGTGAPTASGSPVPSGAASLAPSAPPAPTPIVYTIKKGDTLSKIATSHGLTLEELLAANPEIKNPNRVSEGQQIVIPTPSQEPPADAGGSASPSAGP